METIEELFKTLDPKQKAAFMDVRLGWASSGALCEEVRERLCEPARFEESSSRKRLDNGSITARKRLDNGR